MFLAVAPLTDVTTWARSSGLEIVLIIVGAILLARLVRWLGTGVTGRIDASSVRGQGLIRSEAAKHSHVVTQVVTWLAIGAVYCVAAVMILPRLGVPLTGLVAPAAVVGVALGFGTQRLVQDVLAGVFILIERQYGFGDVVRISAVGSTEAVTGTVEEVTLRITRLRNLSGEVITVANGQIALVTNMSRDWARAIVDVPVPTTVDVHRVREILQQVGEVAREDAALGPLLLDSPTVLGVEHIERDTLHVRIVARTLPGKQFDVGRELRSRVVAAFQTEGINVITGLDAVEPIGTT
ncbi:MAG: moderate conductance mechanosensitive channel [Micromonosporaceae bacterium]|jgi:small conductance mechanosensitive channel|nr:moderate conductance mechanosensitive channel [Micromonosporaceae bacterium]MDT5035388.1 moderate conductance mechanosensitive channel [Micromonosporaceae bacterium]